MACPSCSSAQTHRVWPQVIRAGRRELTFYAECEVLADSPPNAIALNLTQHYVFKGDKTPEKTLNSKITLHLNEHGLIKNHDEEWDHQPNKTGDDGFMGKIQEWRKKADAKMVEAGVSSDPKKI